MLLFKGAQLVGLGKGSMTASEISNLYQETHFYNYKLDGNSIDIASFKIPESFGPEKELALLAPGTIAPSWTLYSTEGKKMSLSEMRGKVVLLDFSFISCAACMLSIRPVNELHEKYKNKNVAIISLNHIDSPDAIKRFVKKYNLQYPVYIDNGGAISKLYNVYGGPYFYFIDKEGKIANVFPGYSDDFEEKTSSVIDALLSK